MNEVTKEQIETLEAQIMYACHCYGHEGPDEDYQMDGLVDGVLSVFGLERRQAECELCKKMVRHERMEEHQIHLCKSCTQHFAECDGVPEFGECVGNDNVIECNGWKSKRS